MDWFTKSRLFDLARRGQRLTNVFILFPLSFLFVLVSQFGAAPVYIWMISIYGSSEGGPPSGVSPLISGFWEGLLLISSFGLLYIFIWLWVYFFEKRPFWTLGYEIKNALIQYGRGFLFGALMFGGAVGILAAFGSVAFEAGDPTQQGITALGGVTLVLIGWIVQGGAEEVLIRGWALPVLGARYRPWIGLLVSALIFASLHGLNPGLSVIALVNLTLFGVFAGLYAMREGSIWGISALHTVWNWVQGNLFGFEVSGTGAGGGTLFNLMETGADWFTGGTFGPEGGFAVTIILLTAIAITVFWKSKETTQKSTGH